MGGFLKDSHPKSSAGESPIVAVHEPLKPGHSSRKPVPIASTTALFSTSHSLGNKELGLENKLAPSCLLCAAIGSRKAVCMYSVYACTPWHLTEQGKAYQVDRFHQSARLWVRGVRSVWSCPVVLTFYCPLSSGSSDLNLTLGSPTTSDSLFLDHSIWMLPGCLIDSVSNPRNHL